MDFKDYYKVLGVEPSATAEEIKRTYKKLARKYHPDVSDEPDAQQKFQEVGEAYEVLKNADKRAEYDELREYVQNPNQFRGGGGQSAESQFEDLLRSIFGDGGGFRTHAQQPGGGNRGFGAYGFDTRDFNQRGRDTHYQLAVTLEEAFRGGNRSLRLGDKTINVKIPAGVTAGKELRLKGQGQPGFGEATAGDLYLEIHIEPHRQYDVDGDDVILVLPVAPWEAALGASVEVPTLGGKVNLKIPADTKSGGKLRLKGRGLGAGDQFVIVKIENPPVISEKQREAYEALRDASDFNPRSGLT